MRFFIKIYRYRGDYSAMVPDLPGCVAVAESIEKVRKLMTGAIKMHLELMQESGERIPKQRKRIQVQAEADEEEAFYAWVEVKLGKRVPV